MPISELRMLQENRSVGKKTLEMHTYRFRLPVISLREIYAEEVAPYGDVTWDDVRPVIMQIQDTVGSPALLIGGWGVRCFTDPPRLTSPEVDFIVQTSDALTQLSRRFDLKVVEEWGCWVGFITTLSGKRIRVDINPSDFFSSGVWMNPDDQLEPILVGSPLTNVSGKLARTLRRGSIERDKIDIAALLLSSYGKLLADQLREQCNLDTRVRDALLLLNISI